MAKNDWAIVVGIWRYPGLHLDLRGPENDAKAFYAWVTDPRGGDVPASQARLILSSDFIPPEPRSAAVAQPNEVTVAGAVTTILDEVQAKAEDNGPQARRLYLYVSGHGCQMLEYGTIDANVLLTANATTRKFNHANIPRLVRACVVNPALFKQVVVFMDCCATPGPQTPTDPSGCTREQPAGGSETQLVFMHAAKSDREARELDFDGKPMGVFTRALLMGLRGGASDEQGNLTAGALANYLHANMRKLLPVEMRANPNPSIGKEPYTPFDDPQVTKLLLARAPQARFKLVIHVWPELVGEELVVLDGDLRPVVRQTPRSERVELDLPAGFYLARIGGRSEVLELPGYSPSGAAEINFAKGYREARVHDRLAFAFANPGIDYFLVDGAFEAHPIEPTRGGEHVVEMKRAGLFKLQARTGSLLNYVYLVVSGDAGADPKTIRVTWDDGTLQGEPAIGGPTLRMPLVELVNLADERFFMSPAPLENTASPEAYRAQARRESRVPGVKMGKGSEFFLGVRDAPPPGPFPMPPAAHPAAGLSLRDAEGRVLVDFERQSKRGPGTDGPWATCNVELDPGVYRLSVETPHGTLSQTVVTTRERQTQVFLLLRNYSDGPGGRRADLQGAAVFLGQTSFEPKRPALRTTELVRLAFRERRAAGNAEMLANVIETSREDPMLRLLGAYLLLALGEPSEEHTSILKKALAALRRQLGEHPDVEALALRIQGARAPRKRFSVPPMLVESWLAIRDASRSPTGLIAAPSLLARVEKRLWGFGPALVWQEPARGRRR
ncbi:caspase family protein [Polyangium jinanense]|uniref:Caspase family protein n=1 Tax=Polyangium jinanense TaxID=2829994 RepID=A0A9X3XAI0_9BACT|nr:caspase family protein [Polyangium jinanense]MDC3958816.1 caspase family protein [Polyangium jinanense]MDC3985203.1 caspase family protein [Polyangium jinanense]